MKRWLGLGAAFAVVAAGWFAFGPQQLGGSVSYVVARGDSMEPTVTAGDLVLVRSSSDYEPGSVVAYRSRELRQVLVHRITARDGERYVMRGDSNDFDDPSAASPGDIIGEQWMRLPSAGSVVEGLREPRNVALLAGVAAFLALGGSTVRRRRRRTDSPHEDRRGGPRLPLGAWPGRVAAGSAVAAMACGALAGVSYTRSTSADVTTEDRYTHRGAFSYDAPAEAGAVYPDGRVDTGEPAFIELVDALDVTFDYRLESPFVSPGGSAALYAEIADDTGWKRRFTLSPSVSFAGSATEVSGTLDLDEISRVTRAVQESTGLARSHWTVALVPVVDVEDSASGTTLSRFAPRYELRFEDRLLRPATGDGGTTGLRPALPGTVMTTEGGAGHVEVLGTTVDVETGRRAGLAGAIVLAALALACSVHARRSRPSDEGARLAARHRRWMVPVADAVSGALAVDVGSLEDLIRIAEQHDELVLHERRTGRHVFAVHVEGVAYRYRSAVRPGAGAPHLANGNGHGSDSARASATRAPAATREG